MPIPGDNGNPKQERQKQNVRIRDVALAGADCQKDVEFNPPEKPTSFKIDGAIYRR